MCEINKNLTPAEKSPWGILIKKVNDLDKKSVQPDGWHWLSALCGLLDTDYNRIKKHIPKEHPLKESRPAVSGLGDLVAAIKKELGNVKKVSKIDFSGLEFGNDINFSNFIFPVEVSFVDTEFHGNANFNRAIFLDNADFENTIFKKQVAFKNAEFSTYTNFKRATFELHAPEFFGATLNTQMVWTDIVLPKFKYANHEKTKEEYDKRIEDNQTAFEALATKLDRQKKYHQQHFFFREEMKCRRALEKNCLTCFSYWLYEKSAGYGYSVGNAIYWWAGHIAVWAGILMYINYEKNCMLAEQIWCSILTSIINAHSFLLSKGANMANCYGMENMKENKLALDLIWAGEAILGAIFLFLVLLTLRVRFRLK